MGQATLLPPPSPDEPLPEPAELDELDELLSLEPDDLVSLLLEDPSVLFEPELAAPDPDELPVLPEDLLSVL